MLNIEEIKTISVRRFLIDRIIDRDAKWRQIHAMRNDAKFVTCSAHRIVTHHGAAQRATVLKW
jgi:hypothetical protein